MNNQQIPEGYKENSQGHMVPITAIKEIDILRDDVVNEVIQKALPVQEQLRKFKHEVMDDIQAFVDLSGEKYGAKIGGSKGNVTLYSFDGRHKITRAIAEHINFDERLQAAKSLIDECILEWSEGSNENTRALISHAFKTDSAGKLSTSRVLGLRQLNINDEKWKQAMEAISDSVTVVGSKAYVRMYERIGEDQWKAIPLDVAAL